MVAFMILASIPGAVLSRRSTEKVFGKIFEIPPDPGLLHRLDAYEGFEPDRLEQSLFIRKQTPILRSNQKPLTGWVYEYNGNVTSRPVIKNGQYSR